MSHGASRLPQCPSARTALGERYRITRSAREVNEARWATDHVPDPSPDAGRAWGSAVHRAIEAVGRGRQGEGLLAYVRAIVRDEGLTPDAAERIIARQEQLQASEEWQRLQAGQAVYEFPLTRTVERGGVVEVAEGVVDAAVFDDGRWQVYDWKTGGQDVTNRPEYLEQVAAYATIFQALTGHATTGKIVRVGDGLIRP